LEARIDPRIVRTRAALREALASLLRDRTFEELTLQEIAEAASLNRATIYKHYADKIALLDAWIADDLRHRLFAATADSERTNDARLAAVIAATCECLRWVGTIGHPDDRLLRPIAEARVRALVLRVIEYGLEEKLLLAVGRPELAAAMASAAIYGAAMVWARARHSSSRALDAHVANAIAGLATLVVPNPKAVRMLHVLTFD
jgi:AcrR family transcriptional regulator